MDETPVQRRAWWRRITLDVSPLRENRDYRLLWTGQLVSMCGSQLRYVAVPYQVYLLTKSPLAVGMIGLFQALPLMAFSLWGGVIADAVDRRKLLLVSQVGLALTSVAYAVGAQLGFATLPFLYAVTATASSLAALDGPARQSLIPTLVRRDQIPAAMTLNQVLFQTSGVLGPALGGLVIARAGLQFAYWIDVVSYAAAIVAVAAMRTPQRTPGGARPGWSSLVEGLRYLGGHKVLLSTMALDFVAMLFGWPRALFPFFAEEIFEVGPQGLGLLFAAPGAGALLGALLGGWVSHVRRQGLAVLAAVVGWGVAIAGFGMLRTAFPLALFLLAVAGAADVFSAIFRGTILQMEVPDHLRGRLTSVNLMVVITGPRFGEVESGVVASFTSPQFAVVSGGLACLVGVGAVMLFAPSLARWEMNPGAGPAGVEPAGPAQPAEQRDPGEGVRLDSGSTADDHR
ncbi:MAG TPA: MFS transporter [Actinomycetota bacterium]|nr:MFS transporter [Actinomycetota bacterium]